MSFNPDREKGTKINYGLAGQVIGNKYSSTYTKHEWIDKYKYVSRQAETQIEPALAAHEMIARLINPINDQQQTFYGVNTRMLTLNQRNEFIEKESQKLKEKAEEYVENLEKQLAEAKEKAEKAAKEASVPEAPIEQGGE